MKAGVGYSADEDPVRAGREAAETAASSSGKPVLTLLFTTDSCDQQKVYGSVRDVVAGSSIAGMCAGGIILDDRVFSKGVGVLTISGDELRVATSLQTSLSGNPYLAGERAGEELAACGINEGSVFVFPDGFCSNIADMVRGLYNKLGPSHCYIGGGAGDNLKFFRTYQFSDTGVWTDAVSVALVSGINIQTAIGHGWMPIGDPLVITTSRGRRVSEIDGRPAFYAYAERFKGITTEGFPEIAMKHPLGFQDIAGNYFLRDPLYVNPDRAIDFITEVPGNAVGNIMHGRVEDLVNAAGEVARRAAGRVDNPRFVLVCDCISRHLLMGTDFEKELKAVRASVGSDVPIIGVLTFGEIGGFADVPFIHNKTIAVAVGGDRKTACREAAHPRYGSLTAELSALHEITSFELSDSEENIAREAIEKAGRLFGVRCFAWTRESGVGDEIAASWGFKDPSRVPIKMKERTPNQFNHAFDEFGMLFMEQADPITDREMRLYTIFARQIEKVLLHAKNNRERRRMEEELMLIKMQRLESLGVLAGGIAHDFNNMLTAIMSNIYLAKTSVDKDSEVYKKLEETERASERAQGLTQQLLAFARGGTPVKQTIYLRQLIADSANFAVGGSNVRCEFSLQDALWPVDADEGQVSQVIHNLAVNSAQAMPDGGIILIRGENVIIGPDDNMPERKGRFVKITVQDRGAGIPEEHLMKIYDPYFTTKPKGKGLGLAVVFSIIRNHGGHIDVESKVGLGTTFTLYLPASEGEVKEARKEAEGAAANSGNILLMDDEESIRCVAKDVLRGMGYSVEVSRDGAEALEAYRKGMAAGRPFDAVIIDLTVPGGMGGKELIKKLREIDPQVKGIVSSGYTGDPAMAEYREHGFVEILPKPYRIKKLRSVLREVIQRKQ